MPPDAMEEVLFEGGDHDHYAEKDHGTDRAYQRESAGVEHPGILGVYATSRQAPHIHPAFNGPRPICAALSGRTAMDSDRR